MTYIDQNGRSRLLDVADETERLKLFIENLPGYAAIELAALAGSTSPQNTPALDDYVAGLKLAAMCTPSGVENLGAAVAGAILAMLPSEEHDKTVQVLNRYYAGVPLPQKFLDRPKLIEHIYTWEAVLDVDCFCFVFINRPHISDDPRDIMMCIGNALRRHGLKDVYARSCFIKGDDNNVFVVTKPAGAPKSPPPSPLSPKG